MCLLCFLICLLLLVSALAGVTVGTSTSAAADIASVKSRIANLLMRPSRGGGRPCGSPLMVHRAGKNIPVTIAASRASHAPSIRVSLRIVIHRRRPLRTLEASGAGRVWLTGRPAHRPCLTGRPGNAEAMAPLLLMLLEMPAARFGLGWGDRRNQHQRRRGYRQCQQPDRKFAHAFLPRWQAMRRPADDTPRRNKGSRGHRTSL